MFPTKFELVSLFYAAKAAGVTGTDQQVLTDVKTKWRAAAKVLKQASDKREYEMTPAEITADDLQAANDKGANDTALINTLEAELAAETAEGGHNRPNVIAEIQDTLAALRAA